MKYRIVNASDEERVLTREQVDYLCTIANMVRDLEELNSEFGDMQTDEMLIPIPVADMRLLDMATRFISKFDTLPRDKDGKVQKMSSINEWIEKEIQTPPTTFTDIVNTANFWDFELLYNACKSYFLECLRTLPVSDIREILKLPEQDVKKENLSKFSVYFYGADK